MDCIALLHWHFSGVNRLFLVVYASSATSAAPLHHHRNHHTRSCSNDKQFKPDQSAVSTLFSGGCMRG
jgi:hypothetical protein